jgi:glycosyltransferase involved in cell wall biosynthesis
MKELYGVEEERLLVVENGVDTKRITLLTLDEKKALKDRLGIGDRVVAVFAGSMHKPNLEAVCYVEELAKSFPNVIFIVIGGAGEVLKHPPQNLIAVGVVSEEEKDIIMKASDIGLNPMVSGSGTNLKVVEYLAYGLVVLTTPFGVRGIRYSDELFVSEIESFGSSFKRLVDLVYKKEEIEALRQKARLLAENYDWEKIAKKLKKRLLSILTY